MFVGKKNGKNNFVNKYENAGRMMAIKAIDVREKSKCDQMMTGTLVAYNTSSVRAHTLVA